MIEIYIVDGREFKVHSSRKDQFLAKYPNAQLKEIEPGKTTPTAPGAVVEETAAPEPVNTDLDSENTSLDLTPGKQLAQQDLVKRQATGKVLTGLTGGLLPIGESGVSKLAGITKFFTENVPGLIDGLERYTAGLDLPNAARLIGGLAQKDPKKLIEFQEQFSKAGEGIDFTPMYELSDKLSELQLKYYDDDGQQLEFDQLFSKGRYSDAAKLAVDQAVGSAPSLAITYAFPLIGSAALGMSTAGNEFETALKERPDATLSDIYKAATSKGFAEFGTEWAGAKLFRVLNGLDKTGVGKKAVKKFTGNYVKEFLTKAGLGFMGEGFTEGATDFLQQKTDQLVYGDEKDQTDFFRGFINSFVVGGLLGGGVSGATGTAQMAKTKQEKDAIYQYIAPNKAKQEIANLNINLANAKQTLENLPDGPKKEAQQVLVDNLQQDVSNKKKAINEKFDSLSKQELRNYADNLNTIDNNISIVNDGRYSEEQQQSAKEKVLNAFKANDDTIGDTDFYDPTVENAIKEVLDASSLIEERFERAKGILPDDVDIQKITTKQAQEIEGMDPEADAVFLKEGGADGKDIIYINTEVAAAAGQTNVIGHEILHYLMSRAFKTDNASMKPLVEDFKKYLQESHPEIYKSVQTRIDKVYSDKKTGRIKEGALEEYINVFSDLIDKKKISVNESLITKAKNSLKRFYNGLGFGNIELNTGEDVFNFIRNYNKNINSKNKILQRRGLLVNLKSKVLKDADPAQVSKFSKEAQKILKSAKPIFASDLSPFDQYDFVQVAANAMFPDVAAQDNVKSGQFSTYEALSADQKLELIEDLLDKGGLKPKFSRSISPDKKDLKGIFDKFVQTPEGKTKYKTLDSFKKSEDYFDAYNEVAEGDAIGKYVRGLVNADKNLGSLDENIKSEVISNIREVITERFLKNFDPAKNESLFGYLFGAKPIVDFALRDVKKKYAKQVKTVSTDVETEGRGFEAVDTESAQIEEIVDRSLTEEQQTFESQLKSTLTVGGQPFITSELAQEIRTAAYETFEGNLPPIDSRDFRKFVTDSYKKKLMPIIKKALGNKKKLADFVLENKQDLLEGLPISYWVQIERLLPDTQKIFTKYVKRLTTQAEIDKYTALGRVYTENDADGPELYQLLNPTDAQIQAFFTGPVGDQSMSDILGYTVSPSTLAARKSELGANIGLQTASDATPGVIQTKPYTEQEVAKIALKVNRDLRQKFSLSGKNVRAIDSAELVGYIKDGLPNSEIASKLAVPESYVEAMVDRLKSKFPANGNKQYGQDQIEYINDNQFNLISVINGIATVSGGLTLNLIDKNGGLTPNGQKYVDQQVDFALNYIQNAPEGEQFQRFVDFITFEGRNIRQGSMYFTTNQQAWDNVYSKVIEKTPEFEGIFKIENGRIYIGEGQITAIKDPTNKAFRMGVEEFKPEFDIQSKKALEYFKSRIDYLKSIGDIDMARTYLQLETGDMRTALKLLGTVSYIEKGNFDNLVYEHMTPSSLLARMAMSYLISDKLISRDLLFEKLENSKVALVSKQTDNELTDLGYKEVGEESTRYDKTGIKERLTPLEPKEITQKLSKSAAPEFNKMIARATGFGTREQISDKVATMLGKNKGRFRFFIPPSADDFAGLMYYMIGKGKQGNNDLKFLKENLFDPFGKAIRKFDAAKQKRLADFRELKKLIRRTPSRLSKKNETGFTNEDSVRIYIWNSLGYTIPGLQKKDIASHVKLVKGNEDLLAFAQNVQGISIMGYPEPDNGWDAGSMTTDLLTYVNKTERSEYLKPWQAAKDAFFTDKTMNKLKAAFGESYTEALEDILYRMETGRRRPAGANKLTNSVINWVNDSVGAIMFFNSRSALLQQLSMVNFINFSDNNPLSAGAAFANQPQFWKDYTFLFNSDFLKQRRSGLKTDVNADEIAKAAESGTNPVRSVIASILKKGFLPTQLADSHAIAMGGASFYRNRLKRYIKEGMTEQEAADKAFLDFQEVAEETQQSSRPDRISMQQASGLGRVILAFANTPMQYARLSKKAVLDLANRRGDWKTNLSKLMYYSVVQNIIFSSLQSAMFALMFTDEEDEETEKRYYRIANSTVDSILRGIGFAGASVAAGKNMVLEVIRQYKSGRPNYEKVALEALSLSPPIDSKISKLASAGRSFTYRQPREKMRTEGISLDNPAFEAVGQIIAATTNLPADRVVRKLDNLTTPVRQDVETWQAISLALGYSKWDVGLIEKSAKKPKPPKPLTPADGFKKGQRSKRFKKREL
tara:strand:+ start:12904 stop:19650 length:6747 start_codon:yes stop_codon:yes gene_type:complete